MKLIGNFSDMTKLQKILPAPNSQISSQVNKVYAAVAYGSKQSGPNFIQNCNENNFDVEMWMRFDHTVPVSIELLEFIINIKNLKCEFIKNDLHSKFIWWQGYGAYIGSANFSNKAWNGGIETGLFLNQDEIRKNKLETQFNQFFDRLKSHDKRMTLNEEFIEKVKKLNKFTTKSEKESKERMEQLNFETVSQNFESKFIAYIGLDHFRTGHFNVKKNFDKYFGKHDEPIEIKFSNGIIKGVINRNANSNNVPRIYGKKGLRDWYKDNNLSRKHIDVHIINKNKIKISKLKHSYKKFDRSRFNFMPISEQIEKGFIDVKEGLAYEQNNYPSNLFGHSYKSHIQRGSANHKYNDDLMIWFPKLFINNEWENTISPDGTRIVEKKRQEALNDYVKSVLSKDYKYKYKRIVFTAEKDTNNKTFYVFRGLFELDRKRTNVNHGVEYKRIETQVKVYPPTKK